MSTSAASKKTISRRSSCLSQLREHISGGESSVQLKAELNALTREERMEALADAHLPIVIPAEQALSMKTDLVLPWATVRKVNR